MRQELPTGAIVPQAAPETGLGHQANKHLAPRLETTPTESDVTTVTEEG